jgi:hypothetical protein
MIDGALGRLAIRDNLVLGVHYRLARMAMEPDGHTEQFSRRSHKVPGALDFVLTSVGCPSSPGVSVEDRGVNLTPRIGHGVESQQQFVKVRRSTSMRVLIGDWPSLGRRSHLASVLTRRPSDAHWKSTGDSAAGR